MVHCALFGTHVIRSLRVVRDTRHWFTARCSGHTSLVHCALFGTHVIRSLRVVRDTRHSFTARCSGHTSFVHCALFGTHVTGLLCVVRDTRHSFTARCSGHTSFVHCALFRTHVIRSLRVVRDTRHSFTARCSGHTSFAYCALFGTHVIGSLRVVRGRRVVTSVSVMDRYRVGCCSHPLPRGTPAARLPRAVDLTNRPKRSHGPHYLRAAPGRSRLIHCRRTEPRRPRADSAPSRAGPVRSVVVTLCIVRRPERCSPPSRSVPWRISPHQSSSLQRCSYDLHPVVCSGH